MSLHDNVWDLPSLKLLMKEISHNLSEGVSVILIWSVFLEYEEFLERLSIYLTENACGFEFINLADISEHRITSTSIGDILGLPNKKMRNFYDQPQVYIFDKFEFCSLKSQFLLLEFYQNWRKINHNINLRDSLLMVIPVENLRSNHLGILKQERGEVKGKIRVIVGIPSMLESQLLSRPLSMGELTPEYQWKEALISSLCANDSELSEYLWQHDLNSPLSIKEALKEYAELTERRNNDLEFLENWRPIPRGAGIDIQKHLLNLKLIQRKVTLYTPEYGEEIHPVSYIRKGDVNGYLDRYIWRGQSLIVLPIIDQVRIKMIDILKRNLKNNKVDFYEAEIKDLCNFLRDQDNYSNMRQIYLNDLERVRSIRNSIAHLKPVSISEWNFLVQFSLKILQIA